MQGGLGAWRQQGLAVVQDPAAQPAPGDFYAYWDPETFIMYEDLTTMLAESRSVSPQDQSFKIIDVRKQPDYAAEHIPFAVNLPLDSIFDGKLAKSSVSDYDKLLSQRGISREKVNIIYGDSSIAPATLYHALIQQGFNAKIYLGGFTEWQLRTQEAQPVVSKP